MRLTYLSIDSLGEGIGASQVQAYVEKLAGRGVEVELHTFEKAVPSGILKERLESAGVVWHAHDFGHYGSAAGLGRVLRARSAIRGAELVHARSDLAAAAVLSARVPRWVWDFRSFYADQKIELGELQRRSPEERVLRRIERSAARRSSAIITLTHAAIPVLVERYGDDVADKAHVITTCVDTGRFVPTEMPQVQPLRLLLAGTINAYYDVPLMLRLAERARARIGAELHVVTPSSTRWDDRLDAVAASRQAASPWVMHEIVAACHAGLSVCREDAGISLKGSMPTKIGEFLASGRPVVVNRSLGDAGALLEEKRCGIALEAESDTAIDDAIDRLTEMVNDPDTSERCRAVALEQFDLDDAVERLLTIYEQT